MGVKQLDYTVVTENGPDFRRGWISMVSPADNSKLRTPPLAVQRAGSGG
jgi:hypothetical protein